MSIFMEVIVTMRIAIIEDQSDDAAILLHFLAQWSEKQQIPLAPQPECFSSGEEFLTTFSGGSYDLLFLDIYLKDLNGMETARHIREIDPDCKIIFTTSSTEFAVESYDVNASWYLVKPFSYETFAKAMSHCETEALEQQQSILLPGEALQNRIYLHQISYAEQQGRYILIHYLDGSCQKYAIRHGDFAPLLLAYPYFCDCIRGIVVNFEAVDSLMRDRFLLKDGTSIPISRLKYEKVREAFLSFFYSRTRGGL